MSEALLAEIRATNFRSARSLVARPGPISALIGEPGAGKSNVLFALRALLDPDYDLSTADITEGQRALSIEATLGDGRVVSLTDRDGAPPIVHFPAALRGGELLSGTAEGTSAKAVATLVQDALERSPAPRVALVRGLEACALEASGVVFAIEEPELFLGPPAHRFLRQLFRRLAERGNQVFFTTHAPGLLSVGALEEVNLISRDELGVTTMERLRAIDADDTFRAMCEFDAERSELLFSRAAVLVEGMTEKVTLPLVFHALGHDPDKEQISIVECGGKANMPLFVEICKRARVPYVVIHDADVRPGIVPDEAEMRLNALVRQRAGADRTFILEPDFEGAVGFGGRGPKPARAWQRMENAHLDELPEALIRAVQVALKSARPGPPSYS